MKKFNKFLEEDRITLENKRKLNKEEKQNKKITSLKIKLDTLDTLRKVKLVTKEFSYSTLIESMLEVYIKYLTKEEQEKIRALE